jgi:hypothetical protein
MQELMRSLLKALKRAVTNGREQQLSRLIVVREKITIPLIAAGGDYNW